MIVFILIYASNHVIFLKLIFESFVKDEIVHRNRSKSHENSSSYFLDFHRVEPVMLLDICYFKSFFRLGIQHPCDEIFTVTRDEFGNLIVSIQNLLVQVPSVWIFEGQVATHEGKQNNSTGPNVNLRAEIPLSGNHFWSSVTWRSARCFQSFSCLVGIWKSEVHYFYLFFVV